MKVKYFSNASEKGARGDGEDNPGRQVQTKTQTLVTLGNTREREHQESQVNAAVMEVTVQS